MAKGNVSRIKVNSTTEKIAAKLCQGYTDNEIMKEMNIKQRSYYEYKVRVFEMFGDIAKRKAEESIEMETHILKDRFNRLYRNLEQRILNRDETLEDVSLASEVASQIATNILRLESEGLKARQGIVLRRLENKATTTTRLGVEIGTRGDPDEQQIPNITRMDDDDPGREGSTGAEDQPSTSDT